MKKIITTIFIGLLLVCCWNPTINLVSAKDDDWWNRDWGYRKEITIDHDMVASNLENFPVLFNNTSSNFSDHAQIDGDDFVFINIDGTLQFNHEIEYYNSSTGELIAWVNVTSISSTEDTSLYIYYGNPSCSNQENIAETWNSNFVGVWHCNNEVDNNEGCIKDSTKYNNNGTTQNMEEGDLLDGRISKALNFDGVNEKVLVYNSETGSLDLTGNMTLECWWKASDLSDAYNALMGKRHSTSGYQYEYRLRDGFFLKNRYSLLTTEGARDDNTVNYEDTWYYGTVTIDAKYITFYNDGSISTIHDALFPESKKVLFGFGAAGDYGNNFAGIIDEVRVSKVPRSEGWVETSYNTMNSPSSFLSVGPEESKPVNIPPIVEITYPTEGQEVSGIITITGNADDEDGTVEYVEVKIDQENWEKATGTTSWTQEWDTTKYSDGSHTIQARSYDGEDYSTIYTINVYVYNGIDNIPPYVEIVTPHYGCIYFTVGGTLYCYVPSIPFITLIIGKIYVIVNASDNVGVESVDFYVDDEYKDTDYEPPYIWLWDEQSMLLIYELKVVARDYAGNEATDMIKVWRVQVLP
jgi:hypothetical protein